MKRSVVILTVLVSFLTVLYHLNSQNSQITKDRSGPSTTPSLESSPLLQFQKPPKGAIGSLEVWDLKPFVPLGQMLSLKDMFKPVYTLVKNGRVYTLQRSDRPNEAWELQGIVKRGSQPRVLLYNSGLRKMKNAGVGDVIDEQLTVKSIGSGSVILEAKDSKKPQRFELHLFNTQKETYAIKRKTL
ncbi:MAG: hypothetical protein WC007_05140 [Pelobacteraceae bacterium]